MIYSAFDRRASKLDDGHPSDPATAAFLTSGSDTIAGVSITESNALRNTAFLCAWKILSEGVASIPLKLFKRSDAGERAEERDHPAYAIFHDQPNPDTTSYIFRETLQGHVVSWGNGYAELVFDRTGGLVEAWQLQPDKMEVLRRQSKTWYRYDGKNPVIESAKILHIPGPSKSGYKGFSLVALAAESLGLGVAAEKFGSAFLGNGSWFGGIVEGPSGRPRALSQEAEDRMLDSLEGKHRGPGRAGRLAVLQEGFTFKELRGIPPRDAQLLELREFSVQEVARITNLPPHLLKDLSRATFSNIEQQFLEYVTISLRPWLVRWEQELNRKVLSPAERRAGLYFEFVVDGLLRGDTESRHKAHQVAITHGLETPNEGRRLENRNPIDAPGADEIWMPMNHAPITSLAGLGVEDRALLMAAENGQLDALLELRRIPKPIAPEPVEPRAVRSLQSRFRLRRIFEGLIAGQAERLVTAQVKAIRRQIGRLPVDGVGAFRQWLEQFFKRHEEFAREVMAPVLLGYMEAIASEAAKEVDLAEADFRSDLAVFHEEYLAAFARRRSEGARAKAENIITAAGGDMDGAVASLEEWINRWEVEGANRIALDESTKAGSAIARLVYVSAGVTTLVWQWPGGTCGICPQLHGRVTSISTPVLKPGDRLTGDFPDFVVKREFFHPPAHRGCVCGQSPA